MKRPETAETGGDAEQGDRLVDGAFWKRREFRGANIFVLRNDDQKHAFMMHKHVAFAL